jgi:hypothetical protein
MGITWAEIDRSNGKLSHPGCPMVFNEAFATGTEPTEICPLSTTARTSFRTIRARYRAVMWLWRSGLLASG